MSPFIGEGHKKLTARLRLRGIRTSRKRVLRLMREAGLLAPTPKVRKRAKRLHDRRITTEVADELWATNPTEATGRCAVFAIVDHCTGEALVDAALKMDRFAAADLLREAIIDRFGSVRVRRCYLPEPAPGRRQLLPLGTLPGRDRSPRHRPLTAFHYEPETNWHRREFLQTLKEQVLWIER